MPQFLFLVCDLVVNKKCKECANELTCAEVATQVAAQITKMDEQNVLRNVSVDVRLSVLKPLVCRGMLAAIVFFETVEGRELISKGFLKAGVSRCFGRAFQAQAISWSEANPGLITPAFVAEEEMPPSAAQHGQEVMAVVCEAVDDELLDLVAD